MSDKDQWGKSNFGGPSEGSEAFPFYSLGQYIGGPPNIPVPEEELLPLQRIHTINLIPFPKRSYDLYQLGTKLLDYVILNFHTRNVVFVEDQYNPQGQFHDTSFIFEYLGQPKFLQLGFTDQEKKSLSLMISNLYNLKGTKRGMLLLLKLLNIDGEIYEWFEINKGMAIRPDGTEIFFSSPIQKGNIVIYFDLNDLPDFDFSDETKLQILSDFMLYICTEIEEFRWKFTQKEQFRNNPNITQVDIDTLDPGDGVFHWDDWQPSTAYSIGDIVLAPTTATQYAGKYVKSINNFVSGGTFNPLNWVDLEFVPDWQPSTSYIIGDRVIIPTGTSGEAAKYTGREVEANVNNNETIFDFSQWDLVSPVEEAKVYASRADSINIHKETNQQVLDIWFPEHFGDFTPELAGLNEIIPLGPTPAKVDDVNDTFESFGSWVLGARVHVDGNLASLGGNLASNTVYYIGKNGNNISFHVEKQDALDGVNPVDIVDTSIDTETLEIMSTPGLVETISLVGNVDDVNEQLTSIVAWKSGDVVMVTGNVDSLENISDPSLKENTLYYIGVDGGGNISFHLNSTDALADLLATRIPFTDNSSGSDSIKISTIYGLTFTEVNRAGFGVKGSLGIAGNILDISIHPDDYEIDYNGLPWDYVIQAGHYLDTIEESAAKGTFRGGRFSDREEVVITLNTP